jgi:hypothetical protein
MQVKSTSVVRTLLLLAPLTVVGCVSFNSHPNPPPQNTTVVVPPATGTTTTTVVCPAGTTAPC